MASRTVETVVRGESVRSAWSNAVLAGLAGGLLSGILLQADGAMPAVAALYGSDSVTVGWLAHLFHGVVFALAFAALAVRSDYRAAGVGTFAALGAAYGLVLWFVGATVVAPLWLSAVGFDAPAILSVDLAGLVGHLVYGTAVGAVFALARRR